MQLSYCSLEEAWGQEDLKPTEKKEPLRTPPKPQVPDEPISLPVVALWAWVGLVALMEFVRDLL